MKSLVLVSHEPLNNRAKQNLCIDRLIKEGYNFYFWDLSNIIHPGISFSNKVDEPYITSISSTKLLKENIEKQDINNTIFFIDILSKWGNRELFLIFKTYKCLTVKLDLYASGYFPMPLSIRLKSLFHSNPFKIVKTNYYRFLYKRYKKSHGVEKYQKTLTTNQKLPSNDLYQKVNFYDYEASRKPDNGPIVSGKYILFLDQYFPLHPDTASIKLDHKKQSEIYLKQLNRFFDRVEEKYQQKVVIALHPKSLYVSSDFGGRTTIKEETQILVKYAQFVLMHYTLSISYMVLYRKPLLFLYSNNIKKLYRSSCLMTKSLALFFDAPLVNISYENTIPEPILPLERYNEYKYTYLTNPEIENTPNAQIILNTIKELDKL